MKSTVLVWGVLGTVVPVFSLVANHFNARYGIGEGTFRLWPSSILLGATIGHEYEPSAYAIIAISIVANVLLYAFVGSLLWCVVRIIQKVATRTP